MSDHICPYWLAAFLDNGLRRLIHNPAKILAPYVTAGATVADIGCGPGYFTLGLARLVGEDGEVIAIDLQPEMLDLATKKIKRAGLSERVTFHRAQPNRLGIPETLDFALAFWMAHEVPDQAAFFAEIKSILKPGGLFLLVEPWFHLSSAAYRAEVAQALGCGLAAQAEPGIAFSRATLFSTG